MGTNIASISPVDRILMGPGPSNVPGPVLRALSSPTIGHLDPEFLKIMNEVRAMLRGLFCTQNELTIPISGTGSAGMETCLANMIEPGDRVLVGVNGVFGARMVDTAQRCGAKVTPVNQEWGRAFDVNQFRIAAGGKSYKLLAVVHAETSTGVLQNLEGFRDLADELGALFLVDTVTSLAGVPVKIDDWGIDLSYSGSQKCLSCPPGLAPVTVSSRAMESLNARKSKVQSWYLDLTMISRYWGNDRVYHHTAPVNMIYGLHEALRLIMKEGVGRRIQRHIRNSAALVAGLEALGLMMVVPANERLTTLHTVRVPDGIDEVVIRQQLLANYNLEIGGGLGPLKGKVLRIGLMGASSTRENVSLCLSALSGALRRQGFEVVDDPQSAIAEAYKEHIYDSSQLGRSSFL